MILLVCGGRKFNDKEKFHNAIIKLPQYNLIVHGDCEGADTIGKLWAIKHGVHYAAIPALWDYYNNSAGPIRNKIMLLVKPDYCLAMPGDNGTQDMVSKCIKQSIPVWRPYG